MWICPGIIAKIIITVAVIASLLSALVEDLEHEKC
nr:MAG TPA: KN17 SH3-like C-terminal domain [Caudoviricetes sp.]